MLQGYPQQDMKFCLPVKLYNQIGGLLRAREIPFYPTYPMVSRYRPAFITKMSYPYHAKCRMNVAFSSLDLDKLDPAL